METRIHGAAPSFLGEFLRESDPLGTEAGMPRAVTGQAFWAEQAVVKGFP